MGLRLQEKAKTGIDLPPVKATIHLFNSREVIMAKLRCDSISEGLRASESLAAFQDFRGRRHFIRVETDFLSQQAGQSFLPIGIVHFDIKTKLVLIELPHEAETGANRLWVKPEQLDEPVEAFA